MFLEPLAAGYLWAAGAGGTAPAWCRPREATPIALKIDYAPIRYDYTRSIADLGGFNIDTVNPYGNAARTEVHGLTEASIRVAYELQTAGVHYGPQTCLWVAGMTVKLRLEPLVYVAHEHKRGTCRFNAVLEHEAKHVKVDQKLAQAYKPVYEKAIVAAVNQYRIIGPFPSDQQAKVRADLQAYIDRAVAQVSKRFEADRKVKQQAVDTLEEYDRVAALCPKGR